MIYFLILIDILINNYTRYTSFLFLIFLYNKPYKDYLLTGLILDFIIFNQPFNTIILSIIYLFNKIFKDLNKNNFYNYLFIAIFNYIVYIILSHLLTNKLTYILILIGKNLLFNIILYILSYKEERRGYNG